MLEWPFWGFRRLDAKRVLGNVSTVGGDHTAFAGVVSEQLGHASDGVHDVVVQWASGKGQPTGNGERTVHVETKLTTSDLHSDRETAVYVDHIDVVWCGTREFQTLAASQANGRRAVEVVSI
jgi:hypothetical protein